ncbi:ubiquinol-cytochrome C reductase cytochrome b subunit [Amycolatopsis mediterranei S699]|uniref:Ubiquinol-cytochrome C reductase cytochrome b subunit n=1 Tax=Amycolatopsis mediterranei (strain S699) TaxID=713604 RepID=A0A9R0P2P1_AMYMS|nr:ubiquinol-cytochrome C reductase cytochrome b subunit [Amycolatopsis mediterranei S699]
MSGLFQINPVWKFGPCDPSKVSAGSQPDWHLGFADGLLRVYPPWEPFPGNHTFPSPFFAGVLGMTVLFTALFACPWIERRLSGDTAHHNLGQRPRDVPVRTRIGMMALALYGVLALSSFNDIIALQFDISLNATTWAGRIGLLLAPPVAYLITYRVCLALQRSDREVLDHGIETGIITRSPAGTYLEIHQPLDGKARTYQGAPVPTKPNKLGAAGHAGGRSLTVGFEPADPPLGGPAPHATSVRCRSSSSRRSPARRRRPDHRRPRHPGPEHGTADQPGGRHPVRLSLRRRRYEHTRSGVPLKAREVEPEPCVSPSARFRIQDRCGGEFTSASTAQARLSPVSPASPGRRSPCRNHRPSTFTRPPRSCGCCGLADETTCWSSPPTAKSTSPALGCCAARCGRTCLGTPSWTSAACPSWPRPDYGFSKKRPSEHTWSAGRSPSWPGRTRRHASCGWPGSTGCRSTPGWRTRSANCRPGRPRDRSSGVPPMNVGSWLHEGWIKVPRRA